VFEDNIINDVKEISGACSITLIDGSSVTGSEIRIRKSTKTLTYSDLDKKLWSLFEEDYVSYSCGN
jgi:hypothetical protein